jgi:acetylglutamate kinase
MNDWTVIKLGGSLLEDRETRVRALGGIAVEWRAGRRIAVVHGGGKRIDGMLARLGIAKETVAGLRVTSEETLEVVVSVLCGLVNKMIVAELHELGVTAVGLSGPDGGILHADLHPRIDGTDLGRVGRVSGANRDLVDAVADRGFLPVIGSVALGHGSTLLNVNADSAASALAVALRASRLLFLTDVPGLIDDKGRVIPTITADCAEQMLAFHVVHGGIVPKLRAAIDAATGGVEEVVISGTAIQRQELFVESGGTRLVAA